MAENQELFRIGVLSKTHGIRGAVKVYPTTDEPERFYELDEVLLRGKQGNQILHVDKVSMQKGMVLVTFKEYDNINQVEPLLKSELFVSREDAIPLEEDEFYVTDLIGLQVRTEERVLGTLKDVMPTGANDVYIIEKEDGKEFYLPAIKDCVKSVDFENETMLVELLPGLEEL